MKRKPKIKKNKAKILNQKLISYKNNVSNKEFFFTQSANYKNTIGSSNTSI